MAHRVSASGDWFTRGQLAALLGVTTGTLEALERCGAVAPSQPRSAGDTRPVLFSQADLSIARAVVQAQKLGLRGASLAALGGRLRERGPRLSPGFTGAAVIDDLGAVMLIDSGQLGAFLAGFTPLPPLMVLPMEVAA